MTRRDRWAKRPCVLRYWAYRDEVRLRRVAVPSRCRVVFVLPMPESWSRAKREAMLGKPHCSTPDLDNLVKGLLDAVHANDAHIHTVHAAKIWGGYGEIRIEEIP